MNSGAYYNRTTGSYYNGSTSLSNIDFTSTGLTETAKSMIGDAKWYLGGTSSYSSSSNGLASHWYKYERGTTVYSGNSTNWIGKVGLMYPSDYGYATSGGSSANRASCMTKELSNWANYSYWDCENNDWLYNISQYQWTMSPHDASSNSAFVVARVGNVGDSTAHNVHVASPVVHLKSTINITGGTGSSTDPFILSGN